jgi:hypothetical protein
MILHRKIDHRAEAENGFRFAHHDFGLDKDGQPMMMTSKARNNETLPLVADWICMPHVCGRISNERLLVMEFVPSIIKIVDAAKLAQEVNVTDAQTSMLGLGGFLGGARVCDNFDATCSHRRILIQESWAWRQQTMEKEANQCIGTPAGLINFVHVRRTCSHLQIASFH